MIEDEIEKQQKMVFQSSANEKKKFLVEKEGSTKSGEGNSFLAQKTERGGKLNI